MHSKCTPSTYVGALSRPWLLLPLPFSPNLPANAQCPYSTSPFWECNWGFRRFDLCRRWFYLDGKPWWLIKWQVVLNDSCLKAITVTFTWAGRLVYFYFISFMVLCLSNSLWVPGTKWWNDMSSKCEEMDRLGKYRWGTLTFSRIYHSIFMWW